RVAMIAQQSWMFLGSFADLRAISDDDEQTKSAFQGLLRGTSIETLAHLGANAFEEVSGEVVNTAMFTLANLPPPSEHRITGLRLVGPKSAGEKDSLLRQALCANAHP